MTSLTQLVVFAAFAANWQRAFGDDEAIGDDNVIDEHLAQDMIETLDTDEHPAPDMMETLDTDEHPAPDMMETLDTDGDKHVSLAEVKAMLEQTSEKQDEPSLKHVYSTVGTFFVKADENADGLLSLTELNQLDAMMHESLEAFRAEELRGQEL
eukprot:TRINITY_DN1144_c0_g1_i3.p1 TRINITY_DN1144_c0_g1~~TRINITY_DN1144_c0_g1_i3.p1  ORF type:complete len:164 (-),score=28.74 TRINITY_DN1144_c0_g1_i3:36-497(-)